MTRFVCALLVLGCALTAGCATQRTGKADPRDPLERINRVTFAFNDALDRAAVKPIAKGYKKVTPHFMQTGLSNFMDNVGYPVTLVNDLLQGKFKATLNDTGRLLLNTTVGLGGFLDPASDAGLDKNDEDFGQTLGKWHIHGGPYLVLPILGPSSFRDGFGTAVDQFAEPRSYIQRNRIRWAVWALHGLDTRARLLSLESALDRTYDRYAFIRNAYLQRRQYLVTDGAEGGDATNEDEWLKESDSSDTTDTPAPTPTPPEPTPTKPKRDENPDSDPTANSK